MMNRLRCSGCTGVGDLNTILAFIKEIFALLSGCALTPLQVQRHASYLAKGHWYPGANIERNAIVETAAESGVCTGEGNRPLTPEQLSSIGLDAIAASSVAEVVQMTKENK